MAEGVGRPLVPGPGTDPGNNWESTRGGGAGRVAEEAASVASEATASGTYDAIAASTWSSWVETGTWSETASPIESAASKDCGSESASTMATTTESGYCKNRTENGSGKTGPNGNCSVTTATENGIPNETNTTASWTPNDAGIDAHHDGSQTIRGQTHPTDHGPIAPCRSSHGDLYSNRRLSVEDSHPCRDGGGDDRRRPTKTACGEEAASEV